MDDWTYSSQQIISLRVKLLFGVSWKQISFGNRYPSIKRSLASISSHEKVSKCSDLDEWQVSGGMERHTMEERKASLERSRSKARRKIRNEREKWSVISCDELNKSVFRGTSQRERT